MEHILGFASRAAPALVVAAAGVLVAGFFAGQIGLIPLLLAGIAVVAAGVAAFGRGRARGRPEPWFRNLFFDNPRPMWLFDRETLRFIEVNDAALEVYGYTRQQFFSMTMNDIRWPEDALEEHARLPVHHAGSARWLDVGEYTHRRASGEALRVEVARTVVRYADRPCILAVMTDVSRRHDAETALDHAARDARRASVLLEKAQEAAQIGHWTVGDRPGGLISWSAEVHRILGIPPGAFDGRPESFLACVHEDDRAAFAADALVPQPAPGVTTRDHRILRGDGEVHWVHVEAHVLEAPAAGAADGDGRIVLGIIQDVTDRRRLEEHLLQTQKIDSLGRLAGALAHDFNNLMTAVIGHADLALDQLPAAGAATDDVRDARESADRAARLAHQLLAFARRQVVSPRVVDLNQAICGSERMLRRIVGDRVSMELRLAPALPGVRIDPGQFEQVLVNLAVNARDAMPDGGCLRILTAALRIHGDDPRVSDEGERTPGEWVQLTVADTGSGMSDDVQAQIFEPFFTTKPEGAGTGLGLATVWGIVRQAGGSIEVQSRPRAGATFEIMLPAAAQ